jgi:hypothetical protein
MVSEHIPSPQIEVTPEMAETGGSIILHEPEVADLGVSFSGSDLARKVYEAVELARRAKPKKY